MGKYLLIFLFLLGCQNSQDDKIKKLNTEIEKLKIEIHTLKNKQPTKDECEYEDIYKKLSKLESDIIQNKKEIENIKTNKINYLVIKPTTFITKKDTDIYSSSQNGKIIGKFEAKNSFTSYKEKNGFVKVTGYFVDGKWTPNKKEWWIKKEDVIIKRIDK